jgi:rod shape-determining protein MreB and related proteins
MSLMPLLGHFTRDVGVDLGTANTLVYVQGEGIVLREPSVIACRAGRKEILAVGNEAKMMIGRTPAEIVATRPMRSGVIADFDTRRMPRPRVMVGIPSGATVVEKRAVIGAGEQAGGRRTYLIEQPLAAAVGAGLEIAEPIGRMIVDIGGGTTEVAVIALGNIVTVRSLRVGGDNMDEAVIQYARKAHNLLIGERMAEDVKIKVGSVYPQKEEDTAIMRGRDLVSGLPRSLKVSAAEIRSAIMDAVATIVNTVKMTLEQTPPELASDIMKEGINLTGGGSLLRGFDLLLQEETGVPVTRVADPLGSVALGTGKALGELDRLKRVLITSDLV